MKDITTIIFDLDGTLLNTLDDLRSAVNYALTQYGYGEKTLEDVRRSVGNGVAKLMERVLPDGTQNPDYESCLTVFKLYYSKHLQDETRPYPQIPELLETLREKHCRTGIVSNKYDAAVKQLKDDYFANLIDVAIGESEQVRKKPAPDCVWQAMRELDCTAQETLYVGDSDVDVETAHNAGLYCVGVTWGFRDETVLRQAGADAIIHQPYELTDVMERLTQTERRSTR